MVTWLDLAKPFYKVEKFQVEQVPSETLSFLECILCIFKVATETKTELNEWILLQKKDIAPVLMVKLGCFLLLTQENHLYVRYILYFRIRFQSSLCLELLIFSSNLNIYLVFWQSYEGRRLLYKENRFSICNYQCGAPRHEINFGEIANIKI